MFGKSGLRKIGRLFVIKTRGEAYLIIFALATGAAQRGHAYFDQFPGLGGHLLFWACMGSVMLAGAKILDCLRFERAAKEAAAARIQADCVDAKVAGQCPQRA